MANLDYKIPARLSVNNKEPQGLLVLTTEGLFFEHSTQKKVTRTWNWADAKWSAGTEITSHFFFFKKEVPYYKIFTNNDNVVKFYINTDDVGRLEYALNELKEKVLEEERVRLEVERKRQEEQARFEAEKKRQEEQVRLEVERKRQEEQTRLEVEKRCQEEQVRLEAERRHREEQVRLEAERKRQEEQICFEAERKRIDAINRYNLTLRLVVCLTTQSQSLAVEKKYEIQKFVGVLNAYCDKLQVQEIENQENCEKLILEFIECLTNRTRELEKERIFKLQKLVGILRNYSDNCQNAIIQYQEEQSRLEVERKLQEEQSRLEAERERQEEQARLEAERKRQEEQSRLEAERKRQEEQARKRQEEQSRLEAERKRQEEQARLEAELEPQKNENTYQFQIKEPDSFCSNTYYRSFQNQIETASTKNISSLGENIIAFLKDFFTQFLKAREENNTFDEAYYDEAIVLFDEAQIPKAIVNAFTVVMEYALEYYQYEVPMLEKIFESTIEFLTNRRFGSLREENSEDYCLSPKKIEAILEPHYYSEKKETNDFEALNEYVGITKDYIDLAEERAIERENIFEEVHQYILSQQKPVTKEALKRRFPKCTRIILKRLTSAADILDYQDCYLSYANLKISSEQINTFSQHLKKYLGVQKEASHIDQIYLRLRYANQEFFEEGFVENSYQLFNLISKMLKKEYSFEYPFVAMPGVKIESPEIKLKNYLAQFEEISIENLISYAKEQYVSISNISEFLVSLEDLMLIKNRKNLINIKKVQLSDEEATEIEALICEELEQKDFCAIRELKCITKFPYCNVPYDEWFIYSILHRWGSVVALQSTPGQFRYSVPVVSLSDEVSKEELQAIADRYAGNNNTIVERKVDNLDDLDALIADEIDLEDIDDSIFDD